MAGVMERYFRETAAGLRRNGIVAFAAMSTAFIAPFLFGLSLLIAREFGLVKDASTGNVQVAVYLEHPVKSDPITRIEQKLHGLDAIPTMANCDKAKTCDQYRKLFAGQTTFLEGVDCEATIPTSFRINLTDPSRYDEVTAALQCVPNDKGQITCAEPGVQDVSDYRALLD